MSDLLFLLLQSTSFFFNNLSPPDIYTLSLHDALPIYAETALNRTGKTEEIANIGVFLMSDESTYSTGAEFMVDGGLLLDRKSTRLNSSHVAISYAVFCLKKKKIKIN